MQAGKKKNILIGGIGVVIIAALVFTGIKVFKKSTKQHIQELLQQKSKISVGSSAEKINNRDLVDRYYAQFGYSDLWTTPDSVARVHRQTLIKLLNDADSLGLDKNYFHAGYLEKYDSLARQPQFDYDEYRSESEVLFTDAGISFLFRVAYGKDIQFAYSGAKQVIDTVRVLNIFHGLLNNGDWWGAIDSLEPNSPQYLSLRYQNNRMRAFLKTHIAEDTLSVNDSLADRPLALMRLKFYELVKDTVSEDSLSFYLLRDAVKNFQGMINWDATGKLDKRTREDLSVPFSKRLAQVQESMDQWRWIGRIGTTEYLLVNLPSARLQIVNRDSLDMDFNMRAIVGKTATKTPLFTAYIYQVSTYPYWVVPFSIATKEILPKLKYNVKYLAKNNFEVLNGKGETVDPTTIKWSRYTTKYFPFTIRQTDGQDNSLGILKFDLSDPFSIYMHDTNQRNLFKNHDRWLSHGCIRLEKPMELAYYVLAGRNNDTTIIHQLNVAMGNQTKVDFPIKRRIAVLVMYMTCDVDVCGYIKFFRDVYKLEEGDKEKNDQPKKPA